MTIAHKARAESSPRAAMIPRRPRRRRAFQLLFVFVALCAYWARKELTRERDGDDEDALEGARGGVSTRSCVGERTQGVKPNADLIQFATFAFSRNAGDRWSIESTTTALRLMYSSLARSQAVKPRLHVYTDVPEAIPLKTTFGTETDMITHACDSRSFPANVYTKIGPWAALSRSKLDAVEYLIRNFGGRVIWIDLDTLVFVDLGQTFRQSSSWVVGYQRGATCAGIRSCFLSARSQVRPEFDVLGDLWSLDLQTIAKVRDFEQRRIISSAWKPPKYDLQTYFGRMLEEEALSRDGLLHRLLPKYNFGFFCSRFMHPTVGNLKLSVDAAGRLVCPRQPGVHMGARVGAISFTAKTFQGIFISRRDEDEFGNIAHPEARRWLSDWFYGPLATEKNDEARLGDTGKNVDLDADSQREHVVFTSAISSRGHYDESDIISVTRWYGRLGNRIRILTMMLEEALVRGCHVRILDKMLPGWRSQNSVFVNERAGSDVRSKHTKCRKLSGRHWYEMYLKTHSTGTLRRPNGFSDERIAMAVHSPIAHVIARYFESNETHAFGRACEKNSENILAVHVRAGDIVSGRYDSWTGNFVAKQPSKHTTYGPFPTSYYANVQKYASESGLQMRVFCEDFNSPTCEFFQQLGAILPSVTMRVGRGLISDLNEFNCASHVAFSYGSFRDAIVLRNRQVHTHDFFFDRKQAETACSRASSGSTVRHRRYFFAFRSDELEYQKSIRRNNWRNTALQRHLVDKHYQIDFIECENRREDDEQ